MNSIVDFVTKDSLFVSDFKKGLNERYARFDFKAKRVSRKYYRNKNSIG